MGGLIKFQDLERTEKGAKKILEHFGYEFENAPCSKSHHLNYRGGLKEHSYNVLKYAKKYFPDDKNLHFLALIHDLGKMKVYYFYRTDDRNELVDYKKPYIDHNYYTFKLLKDIGVSLSHEEAKAIKMHHGGWSQEPHIPMNELGVKLHFCDMMATINEK